MLRGKQTGKPQASANARGYAQRQQRRSAKQDVGDAYEYSADKIRREKVALELDRDEARAGSSDDGDGDDDLRAVIAKRVQEDAVRSEDDEEIDSDDAFEGSDDERYAALKFAQKKTVRCPLVKLVRDSFSPSRKVQSRNLQRPSKSILTRTTTGPQRMTTAVVRKPPTIHWLCWTARSTCLRWMWTTTASVNPRTTTRTTRTRF